MDRQTEIENRIKAIAPKINYSLLFSLAWSLDNMLDHYEKHPDWSHNEFHSFEGKLDLAYSLKLITLRQFKEIHSFALDLRFHSDLPAA